MLPLGLHFGAGSSWLSICGFQGPRRSPGHYLMMLLGILLGPGSSWVPPRSPGHAACVPLSVPLEAPWWSSQWTAGQSGPAWQSGPVPFRSPRRLSMLPLGLPPGTGSDWLFVHGSPGPRRSPGHYLQMLLGILLEPGRSWVPPRSPGHATRVPLGVSSEVL
jgi:hypothetical protein